jgi:hypothetical protein
MLCPDLVSPDDALAGTAYGNCGDGAGSHQERRIGRLPWKTLRLPDLRDDSGERLWYAVSTNFKNNTRINVLNSDTPGTITIRDSNGSILFDGTVPASGLPDIAPNPGSGVVAVIIAPGAPIVRADNYVQARSGSGLTDPRNYLDISSGEDNAAFTDKSQDGFIQGPIRNNLGQIVLNDHFIVITDNEIMAAMEKRVAKESLKCLQAFYSTNGAYPLLAPLGTTDYAGATGTAFGFMPDTQPDPGGGTALATWTTVPSCLCVSGTGPSRSTWWDNWKDHVLAQVPTAALLTVDGTSVSGPVAVIPGRTLSSQTRPSTLVQNYLECGNADPSRNAPGNAPTPGFVSRCSSSFNDRLAY